MRVLLDEHIDVRYRLDLPRHEVFTVEYMGWKSKKNGELLALADPQFDVFLTADQELPSERRRAGLRRMGIVLVSGELVTRATLRLATLRILEAIERVRPGSLETVYV